ncbi:MAG: hypothetical protein C0615_07785 [Desulfuromonas sp.]|nr:MAG: hypothetical protein C0615_07785 [Desulfuromonas sp.]
MRGSDIIRELETRQQSGQPFIRWWRRENDFADYELLKDFRKRVEPNQEFEGFELLDIESMWKTLVKQSTHRLARDKRKGVEVIIWEHEDTEGYVKEQVCPFSPDAVMTIFDVETKGYTLV